MCRRLTESELRPRAENLRGRNRERGILEEAEDIAKQSELKVGNYAEKSVEAEFAGESDNVAEINERFNEQLERWESGQIKPNEVVNAGQPMGVMRRFMPNIPILFEAESSCKVKKEA